MDWLNAVRNGDFAAIPMMTTFEEASELGLLIEAYQVVGGVEQVQAISNRVVTEIRRRGRTRASALDIWLALFGQQRAHCHAGYPPSEDDERLFQELVRLLRMALLALTPKQKAGIMSVLGKFKPLG